MEPTTSPDVLSTTTTVEGSAAIPKEGLEDSNIEMENDIDATLPSQPEGRQSPNISVPTPITHWPESKMLSEKSNSNSRLIWPSF